MLPKEDVATTPVGNTLASHVTVSSPNDIVEAAPETPVIAAPAVITLPKAVVPTTPVSVTLASALGVNEPHPPVPAKPVNEASP